MRRLTTIFVGISTSCLLLTGTSLVSEGSFDDAKILLVVAVPIIAILGVLLAVLEKRGFPEFPIRPLYFAGTKSNFPDPSS